MTARTHEPTSRNLPWDVMGGRMQTAYGSVAEALNENDLDFTVDMVPLFAETKQGSLHAPKHKAVVRPGPGGEGQFVVGVTGNRFTPIANADAFAVADDIVSESKASITGAADFHEGRASLLVVTFPEGITVTGPKGKDHTAMNLLIKNAHDGSAALTFALTGLRLACTNAVSGALRNAARSWKISHTPRSGERLELARKSIMQTLRYTHLFQEQAQAMMDQKIVDAEFEAMIARLWPVPEDASDRVAESRQTVHSQVRALYHGSPTMDTIRGTRWGAYNAVVEWLDWERPVRGNEKRRAEGSLEGAVMRLKDRAWDLAGV